MIRPALLLMVGSLLAATGCAAAPRPDPPRVQPELAAGAHPRDSGASIASVRIPPSADGDAATGLPVLDVLTGRASYYSDALAGRPTASGEPYDPTHLIAASPDLPFGTLLRVTNLDNGRSVLVHVIDRGPFAYGRILDLSRRAAEELDMIRAGHVEVRIEVLDYGG